MQFIVTQCSWLALVSINFAEAVKASGAYPRLWTTGLMGSRKLTR